jgi:two-component system cell cycle response regulator
MPHVGSRTYSLDIIGFSPADRTLIASMFALSRRRAFQYEPYAESLISLGPRKRPDLFLVDADSLISLAQLKSKSPDVTHPAVLVGSHSHGLEWLLVKRPVKWLELFDALDKSLEKATEAQAMLPTEKHRGWPFFDRRSRNRIDAESEIKPLPVNPMQEQPRTALSTSPIAPTLSLLDPQKSKTSHKSGLPTPAPGAMTNTVLIVDSDGNRAQSLAKQLRKFELVIEFAISGEQALGMIARRPFFCVLLQASLPGIDGYQVCRLIKSETSPAPLVVLLSVKTNALERTRAWLAGCDGFLNQQGNVDTLADRLAPYVSARIAPVETGS